jgi:hypothetical protein
MFLIQSQRAILWSMPFEAVSFTEVTTEGLESSPVAEALASLRANEARYFSISTNTRSP